MQSVEFCVKTEIFFGNGASALFRDSLVGHVGFCLFCILLLFLLSSLLIKKKSKIETVIVVFFQITKGIPAIFVKLKLKNPTPQEKFFEK